MQPQRPQPKSPPARSWSCSTGQSHFPQWQLQPACAPSAGCNRHCADTLDKVPRLKAVTEAPPELSAGKYQRSPTSSRPASTANWQLPSQPLVQSFTGLVSLSTTSRHERRPACGACRSIRSPVVGVGNPHAVFGSPFERLVVGAAFQHGQIERPVAAADRRPQRTVSIMQPTA